MSLDTRWVWIPLEGGGRALAFKYLDPIAGPSAKGARVPDPITQEQVRAAVDHPDWTFRQPAEFGAVAIGAEEALRLGLPRDPPWIGFLEPGRPVPPPRGELARTVAVAVRRAGALVAGARVEMGHVLGPARELIALDARTTDARGRCEFPLAPSQGPVAAVAHAQGARSKLVAVPDSGELELELLALGTVEGTVLRNNAPAQASVSLTALDGGTHAVRSSDARGRYRIEGVVPGRYAVCIEGIDSETFMTAGTPTHDEVAVTAGEALRRDYALVSGQLVGARVAVRDQDHNGEVYLFCGNVAPRTSAELRELWRSLDPTLWQSADCVSNDGRWMTTEFANVTPGAYTLCVTPSDHRGGGHAEQPVGCARVVVGTAPVTVEITLPPLRPR